MMTVGLTGGIGSGKTTVAGMFADLGVPVYNSDREAKKLMEEPDIARQVTALIGPGSYRDGKLQREFISSKVFRDKQLLEELNAVVHPAVGTHFSEWALSNSHHPYLIQEAAILFENGSYKRLDKIILITAPEETRIRRIAIRDAATEEAIRQRMDNQWPDEKKIPLADFVIENTDLQKTREKVSCIHAELLKISG